MKENYLALEQLSVGYHNKSLIDDICLNVRRGEIVTLIGPNGAGKSTILKTIARQLALLRGDVVIDGSRLNEMTFRELSTRMAVVLTDRPKPELLTCHDIVAAGRYPYTGRLGILTHEDEAKVDEALETVHARELGSRDFNAISDGQKQRVMLARAICQEPEIILLDEPTSFLDIRYKLELLSILRRMAKEKGITIVMTLHEIDLAQKISDRIVCVSGEHTVRAGTPEEIFHSEVIRELYDIDNGFYDPVFGSIELARPEGNTPQVFVISSGGTGIRIYRELQQENIPFAAGILYENDIDYQLASLLACKVISERPFAEISPETYEQAVGEMEQCQRVIYAGVPKGGINARLFDLVRLAADKGILEEV